MNGLSVDPGGARTRAAADSPWDAITFRVRMSNKSPLPCPVSKNDARLFGLDHPARANIAARTGIASLRNTNQRYQILPVAHRPERVTASTSTNKT